MNPLKSSDADLIEVIRRFVESVRGKRAKSSRVAVRAASGPLAPVFRGEQLCRDLSHEGLQRRWSRTMAVRIDRSLRMQATMATLCFFPRARRAL
jgi:hypothetical protein